MLATKTAHLILTGKFCSANALVNAPFCVFVNLTPKVARSSPTPAAIDALRRAIAGKPEVRAAALLRAVKEVREQWVALAAIPDDTASIASNAEARFALLSLIARGS